MSVYKKWLGAGLGWMAGGPLGGLLGFAAGKLMEDTPPQTVEKNYSKTAANHVTEKEATLIILASHAARADGSYQHTEIDFIRQFLRHHFGHEHIDSKMEVVHHCLQKEYDLLRSCDHARIYMSESERWQLLHFLFQLCGSDEPINPAEEKFLFKMCGWLGFNDLHFKEVAAYYRENQEPDARALLGVKPGDGPAEIRRAYRQYVLHYHPDRRRNLSAEDRRKLEEQLMRVREAYEQLKREMEFQ